MHAFGGRRCGVDALGWESPLSPISGAQDSSCSTISFAWYVAHADAEVDDAVDLLVHLVHLFAMP